MSKYNDNVKINVFSKISCTYLLFFFYKHHFYRQRQAKTKQMLNNTLKLNFCYLTNNIYILHPGYHPKIIGPTLKNLQKNKCVCIHEIVRLIRPFIKRQTSGISNDNKWQRVVQRMTTIDNKWKWVTVSDSK